MLGSIIKSLMPTTFGINSSPRGLESHSDTRFGNPTASLRVPGAGSLFKSSPKGLDTSNGFSRGPFNRKAI